VKRALVMLVLFLILVAPGIAASPRVVINEIMYNPADNHSDYDGEWLELYNPNNFSVNLSNWDIIYDGHNEFTFPSNAVISPGGYIVVSRDTLWFQRTYGKGTVGDDLFGNLSSYRFSNTGTHWIALLDASNVTIDNVTYSNRCSENYSLERKDPLGSSNATGDNWACSENNGGTPLEKNSIYVPFFGSIIAVVLAFALLLAVFRRS